MNALGFDTPTTKPCRTRPSAATGERRGRRRRPSKPCRCRIACTPRWTRYAAPEQLEHREHGDRLLRPPRRGRTRRAPARPAGRGSCRARWPARRRGRRPAPGRSRTPRSGPGSRSAPGRRRRRRAAARGTTDLPRGGRRRGVRRSPCDDTRDNLHGTGLSVRRGGRAAQVPLPATRVITIVASCVAVQRSRLRSSSGTTSTPRFLIVSRPMPRSRSAALQRLLPVGQLLEHLVGPGERRAERLVAGDVGDVLVEQAAAHPGGDARSPGRPGSPRRRARRGSGRPPGPRGAGVVLVGERGQPAVPDHGGAPPRRWRAAGTTARPP